MTEVGAHAVAAPIDAAELECTLETHVASESKDDGTQEDSADVHKENKYGQAFEVRFLAGAQIQMDFQTRTGGEHVVTKVVEGGSAEQQDVHVGDAMSFYPMRILALEVINPLMSAPRRRAASMEH